MTVVNKLKHLALFVSQLDAYTASKALSKEKELVAVRTSKEAN